MNKCIILYDWIHNLLYYEYYCCILQTFDEVDTNHDGKIDFDEYKLLVQTHPAMLDQMTVNISAHLKAARDLRERSK